MTPAPDDPQVETLLARMDVQEKVGLLFHAPISFRFAAAEDGRRELALAEIEDLILIRRITHFNVRGPIRGAVTPGTAARFLNDVQAIAARAELPVPVTISSDPRHGFANHPGVSMSSGWLSQWPEPIALAAVGDPDLVTDFGHLVRREYRALGIHVALHPQADVASEPRWMRIAGTFGQDVDLVCQLTTRYIQAMQGDILGPSSVGCMTKHFPGAGPQSDGEDPHFDYGKDQIYPAGRFADHLRPFAAAIAAGTLAIMPYYGRPIGLPVAEVGFAFNADIIAGLLRTELAFDGIVCSDWGVLNDAVFEGAPMPALAWGLEDLDLGGRIRAALDAGIDQFGGESCTDALVALVEQGLVAEERLDVSARRLLAAKFALGLFDDPYTDPDRADRIVGSAQGQAAGAAAQRRSVVVLKNDGGLLPLREGQPVRRVAFEPGRSAPAVEPGSGAPDTVTFLRTAAPFEPREQGFERFHHAGRLDFAPDELAALLEVLRKPSVLAIELDRPAVIPELLAQATAVVAFCGASDEVLADVIFGRASPEGRLPFDLPKSMAAVRRHPSDQPGGFEDPLLPMGWGLRVVSD